jgi:hypothetical protein
MTPRIVPFAALLALSTVLATACGDKDDPIPDDTGIASTDADGDGYSSDEDCDDGDPAIHPGADEVCDEVDNDCDGEVDEDVDAPWYPDLDGDGYGDEAAVVQACEQPSGYIAQGEDCDDDDPEIHPGADERCNDIDDDCDGEVDEDPVSTWYADADGDGYGNAAFTIDSCDPGSGWVTDDTDCDDTEAGVNPGAEEACNGIDDDCDGDIDEDIPALWYADADGDGFGNPAFTSEECDPGSGWVADGTDCDDTNAAIHPDADEVCDGLDNDCDGAIDDDDDDAVDPTTWYLDGDSDGYGLDSDTLEACDQPSGYAEFGGDCDDSDTAYNPGAAETDCTDPADYNCDGSTGYSDDDGDGWAACEECDDTDAANFPGADERCDGVDNDCDGTVDEDDAIDASSFCEDADGDGYGDPGDCAISCTAPAGWVGDDGDCDDRDATVNPGATELCNATDDDCDGLIDEDDPDVADMTTWYADSDGDGYGDAADSVEACSRPSGYIGDSSDCDDADAAVNPGAVETCNGDDDDCDGLVDDDDSAVSGTTTWWIDYDGDGYGVDTHVVESCQQPSGYVDSALGSDCDDLDTTAHPGADELCDGVDNDCDGSVDEDDATDASTWYADVDADGYGDAATSATACAAPSGYVADSSDCDDANASANPGASEICDGVDNDCDGDVDEDSAIDAATWYADVDGDGYGDASDSGPACTQPSGHVSDDSDCDDGDAAVNPAATEICDSVDNDCDGTVDEDDASDATTWYADADVDGYGDPSSTALACSQPSGYVAAGSDCDDHDDDIHPGATEICDSVDNDCDGTIDESDAADAGTWYADADSDGYGDAASTMAACDQPSGYVADSTDCDDGEAAANPGAVETCDGIDNDCDGLTDDADSAPTGTSTWYADADADGYGDAVSTTSACDAPSGYVADSTDCDDGDAGVNPGAAELCDGTDTDCDGSVDEDDAADAVTWYADADSDGYGESASASVACYQPTGHVSDDSDCDDGDSAINPAATEICDSVDNDCDGLVDDDDDPVSGGSTWYADDDGDGFGDPSDSTEACLQPSGYVADATDCDDTDATVQVCDYTFSTCGASGAYGPAQADCDSAYTGSSLEGLVVVADGIQIVEVPASGTYLIEAWGAQGESADSGYDGGLGAYMSGEFALTGGELLQIVVGQMGEAAYCNGSGGGGSFVVDESDNPLLIAGGGGGTRESVVQDGCDAPTGEYGITGSGSSESHSCATKTGDLTLGGIVSGSSWGSGGAGFSGNGAVDGGWGGTSYAWASGMTGGVGASCTVTEGGFGGGGTGNGCCGGGGGGGYSGGDGGRVAGGGGSYNIGDNQSNVAGDNAGDGMVALTWIGS